MMKSRKRILIVDDNALLRLGLSDAISAEADLLVAGEAVNTSEAIKMYRELKPDLVTLDYRLPDESGIQCAKKILEEFPDARILLLSAHDEEEIVWNACRAGIHGYLTKSGELCEITEAIREILQGARYFPAAVVCKLRKRHEREDLSGREKDVLELVVKGYRNKEICDLLEIAEPTVKMHISRLMRKLDVGDRTQAAVFAIKHGLVDLDDI